MSPKTDADPGRRRDWKVGLYPRDMAVVERVMSDGSGDDVSSAVRFIIRDWARMKGVNGVKT